MVAEGGAGIRVDFKLVLASGVLERPKGERLVKVLHSPYAPHWT